MKDKASLLSDELRLISESFESDREMDFQDVHEFLENISELKNKLADLRSEIGAKLAMDIYGGKGLDA